MSGSFGFNKSESKSKPKDAQAQKFQNLREPFAGLLAGLLGETDVLGRGDAAVTPRPAGNALLQPLPAYQGQFSAPISANERALLGALMQQGGARQGLLGKTLGGGFTNVDANPFAQQVLDMGMRKIGEHYENVLGRTLPGQFTGAGQMVQPGQSSAFDRAAAIESRGFANALSDYAAQVSSGIYEAERGRQQEAIQLSQQEVDTTIKNLKEQALPRLIEQYGIDQGLGEFRRQTDMLMQVLQLLAGVTQPAIGQKGSASSFGMDTSGGVGSSSSGKP